MELCLRQDIVNTVKENSYKPKKQGNTALMQYEYSHDNNLKEIVSERVPIKARENEIRERFAKSTNSFDRQKMFSHYTTTYDSDNQTVQENIQKNNFKKAEIPDWFKAKYHNYQKGLYTTEHTGTFGIHGDVPFEKFFNTTQNHSKIYSDNYHIGKGTAKASDKLSGYKGFVPVNEVPNLETHQKDPFINVQKNNHLDNYMTRIPGYQGHIPRNPSNIKGNLRPYCLSTKDEKF